MCEEAARVSVIQARRRPGSAVTDDGRARPYAEPGVLQAASVLGVSDLIYYTRISRLYTP